MGHLDGKDVYRQLGAKIDNLTARAPWNDTLHQILTKLYSREEADVVVKAPYGLTPFEGLVSSTGYEGGKLERIIRTLCEKGLVMDLCIKGKYYYLPSPMVIGIFEFTMMRMGEDAQWKEMAPLFHAYLSESNAFAAANYGNGERISIMRSLPHEGTVLEEDYIEVLSYEKATEIVQGHDTFSMGLCSCRHEMFHLGKKACASPLDNCSSFGFAAEYLVRNNMAREVSRSEMLDNIARSKEMGLVLNADNVKRNVTFICHCCKCCCHALMGISKHGFPNSVVTSNFLARIDEAKCSGCGACAKACPISAIEMVPIKDPPTRKKKDAVVDTSLCLGCGVCSLKCRSKSLKLEKRSQRVLHPETTFEKIILSALERGTLQNQIFENPAGITQKFMRGFLGGFLRLSPVKKALMSETLRSAFLAGMTKGARLQGKGWITAL